MRIKQRWRGRRSAVLVSDVHLSTGWQTGSCAADVPPHRHPFPPSLLLACGSWSPTLFQTVSVGMPTASSSCSTAFTVCSCAGALASAASTTRSRSAADCTSSNVALKAATSCAGSFWMKPGWAEGGGAFLSASELVLPRPSHGGRPRGGALQMHCCHCDTPPASEQRESEPATSTAHAHRRCQSAAATAHQAASVVAWSGPASQTACPPPAPCARAIGKGKGGVGVAGRHWQEPPRHLGARTPIILPEPQRLRTPHTTHTHPHPHTHRTQPASTR